MWIIFVFYNKKSFLLLSNNKNNFERGLSVFEQQIKLSVDLNLPVIIHDREAHQDTLEIVKKYRPKGIIHCFSGSAETAKEFVSLGMYIGFTGSITFKNANKILLAEASVPDVLLPFQIFPSKYPLTPIGSINGSIHPILNSIGGKLSLIHSRWLSLCFSISPVLKKLI